MHTFSTSAEVSCSAKEFIFGQTIASSLQALCLTRASSWKQGPSVWIALQDYSLNACIKILMWIKTHLRDPGIVTLSV